MNDYGDKFSNQVIVPEIAMIKCYLDLTEMDQKIYAEMARVIANLPEKKEVKEDD